MINKLKLLILIFILTISPTLANQSETYKVIKVIDGDTIYVDFNKNGIPEKEEKVRLNGIDTFEVKPSPFLDWQMKKYNLTQDEALGLGYFGKEFAKKKLLNKEVFAVYSADEKTDKNERKLMSVYYDCKTPPNIRPGGINLLYLPHPYEYCKCYEKEVLKEGFATVYKKSNLAGELKQYENLDKPKTSLLSCVHSGKCKQACFSAHSRTIKAHAKKSHRLNLVLLNKRNGKYHKPTCEYGLMASDVELIEKPLVSNKLKLANCCDKQKDNFSKYAKYSDENIEIYFLDPTIDYKKNINGALKRLVSLIYQAKQKIYFAIYGVSNWDILNALIDKFNAGLDMKWVTDVNKFGNNNYSRTVFLQEKIPNFKTDFTKEELKFNNKQEFEFYLKNQKIKAEFKDDEIEYFTDQLMHNKFFIFDNDKISTGSVNMSNTGIGGINTNANDFLVIKSSIINEIYTKEFLQMYNNKFHRNKIYIPNKKSIKLNNETTVSIYFAPIDKYFMKDIISIIDSSKEFVYLPMFYLTDGNVIQALINAKERGVDVRVILDASSAISKYSKHRMLRIANIPVKVENWVGKMHMKCLITEKYVVTGSLNWTNRAQYFNDENSLIIENAKIASVYQKQFLHLYNSIPDKWLSNDPKPEGKDTPGSCSDGLDNDHDGFVDMDDLDCNANAKQGKHYEKYYENLE